MANRDVCVCWLLLFSFTLKMHETLTSCFSISLCVFYVCTLLVLSTVVYLSVFYLLSISGYCVKRQELVPLWAWVCDIQMTWMIDDDGSLDGWSIRWMIWWMDDQFDGRLDGWSVWWMIGWMDDWLDGWWRRMDDGWWTFICIYIYTLKKESVTSEF